MNPATVAFLRKAYREYYFGHADSIEFPPEVQAREFGYIPFGGGMVRHLSFRSRGEAVAEIVKQSPSSVYCSNATYESPGAPIDEKGWRGAELIFDIDATDIPTPCKKSHDVWYCGHCHASGKLPRPQKCPKCAGQTADFHGTCRTCIDAAKDHTLRVIDFLAEDFGVARDVVTVYFSGNRGFHLHVSDNRFGALDQAGRSEIAGYISGTFLPSNQALASAFRRKAENVATKAGGWSGRIARYVEQKRDGYTGTIQRLVSDAVASQRAMIDSSVTTDIHRVFRLAGTLHGTTGMSKIRVKSTESFDFERDPVVLSSRPIALNVVFYPRFKVAGSEFGPFRSQMAELPTYAAVSILTRGLGEVV